MATEKQIRLDKFISEAAGLTRKDAKAVITKGRVSVGGEICKNSDRKVLVTEEICLDGVKLGAAEEFLYLMLHKPSGVVSATEDGRDRTVLDLVREREADETLSKEDLRYFVIGKRELFPVGRLDKDTEGLLLLTDDGELAHRLLSPKHHVDKVYAAKVSGTVPQDAAERFAEGIQVGKDYKALPAKLEVVSTDTQAECAEVKITLHEGKFHQVKRMCHEIGCEVTYLKRLSMGALVLDEALQPGEVRRLTEEEREQLCGEVKRQ
ncbi:MAG: rRNA pseudouridine synthase [Lachnospiraceae bacterium]|nr:rRNA pseudouridine synthase [Lachnospiraceae bacterium]